MNTQKTTHLVEAPSGTFADRIKVLIQRVGSVTEIARMCGFSEGVVRSWRDGNTDPSRARCVTLAKTLGISLVWLVAGEGTIQTEALAQGEDMGGTETSLAQRHRSKLRTAADTLQASGVAMDPTRLNTALRILQSELDLAESRLTLAENADMLAELYDILGPNGDVDATAMVAFNHRLGDRIRRNRSAA
jgi:transcriptional regulator with XRE-family HTH domain